MSTMSDMDTNGAKRRHKRWPEALKREIVAATLVPGASVSMVARQYDVNANQVFSWRRRYRETPAPPPAPSSPQLVPVTITAEFRSHWHLATAVCRFGADRDRGLGRVSRHAARRCARRRNRGHAFILHRIMNSGS